MEKTANQRIQVTPKSGAPDAGRCAYEQNTSCVYLSAESVASIKGYFNASAENDRTLQGSFS